MSDTVGMARDCAFLPQFGRARELEIRLSELGAQILEGIAVGETTIQLANRLHLSRQGVEYHVTALLRVMSAPNRPSLISRAYSVGMFRPGEWPPRVAPEFVR
jgi:DNA-binding CsgD family transcriptional regulator